MALRQFFDRPGGKSVLTTEAIVAMAVLGSAVAVAGHALLLGRKNKKSSFCSFLALLNEYPLGRRLLCKVTGEKMHYPRTRRSQKVNIYHGHEVPDPYEWLEQPDDPEVKAWVKKQNLATDTYFANLKQEHDKFFDRMEKLYFYPKYSCLRRKGDRYFFSKQEGLQNQFVLCTQDSLASKPRVLMDPNALREDGTASLAGSFLSDDGSLLAYMIAYSGSDWRQIHVMDVASGIKLPDEINWCKFSSVAWTSDNKGFFYTKYPPPANQTQAEAAGTETEATQSQKVYYHRLGSQAEDPMFFGPGTYPKWMYGVETDEGGHTLIITVHQDCDPVNRIFYFDLCNFDGVDLDTIGPCVRLIDNFDHGYEYITNEGRTFYFKTNRDAKRYKVVKVTLPAPGDAKERDPAALKALKFEDVVPQEKAVLEDASPIAKKFLVLEYARDVVSELQIRPLNGGQPVSVGLPGKGTIAGLTSRKKDTEFFFQWTSFNDAGTVYRAEVEVQTQKGQLVCAQSIPTSIVYHSEIPGLNAEDFVNEQVFYRSKDGTKIPMFIVKARDRPPEPAPLLLYGYGGFSISIAPSFSLSRLIFIKHFGGVVAVANIRGGGEYGEEWHEAGIQEKKQNVFDDFIAAAEYLVEKNYTTSEQIAINGGSNGGLLVGACINQRPDLFGCAVAAVGVMDMLKFHKFTIGYAWCSDYGNAESSEYEFKFLYNYSPVHNINTGPGVTYPATLLTTGDHDDRVVPLHSYKYIAALQHAHGHNPEQTRPLVIRIDTRAGHGAGKPTAKIIAEVADMYAFIAANTGAHWQA